VALGWIVNRHLVIGTDLRLFMPSPRTPEERLILDEIGEGPASRMLLLAISGPDARAAADTSRALAAALRSNGEFRLVANGESGLDAIPDSLLAYRYLRSPTLDHSSLDAGFLRTQLEERVRDLASPAAGFLEPLLPRDPTLELLKLADSWLPARQPQTLYDVWFDHSGHEALLVAETRAAGFDRRGSGRPPMRCSVLRGFAHRRQPSARGERPRGVFRTHAGAHAEEAQWLGSVDVIGIVILLLVAYRSLAVLVLG
jgi:predicted exporter